VSGNVGEEGTVALDFSLFVFGVGRGSFVVNFEEDDRG
jgi:uncharacterized YccA/Bax inhibitor family protein